MSERTWRWADHVAHFLYEPALMGSKVRVVPEWATRIHLIPRTVQEKMCKAYDRRLTGE